MDYRTVIHLQWHTENGEQHEYYGSPASLFDKHSSDELGISLASLNNYFHLHPDSSFKQTKNGFIIRRGILYTKPTSRGRKANSNED